MTQRWAPLGIAVVAALVFGIWYVRTAPSVVDPADAEAAADFPNYYFGGERLRDGRPVYDVLAPEVLAEFGIEDYPTYPADPPPTVVLFAPVSFLSYGTAWYVWSGVSVTLLAGSVFVVARTVGYPVAWSVAMAAVALLTNPARFLIARNHMETLLLALGVAGWLALRTHRERGAGLAFGVATGLKFFPGMWLLGLLRTNTVAGAVGAAAALAVLLTGMALSGVDNAQTFWTDVISRSQRWYGTLGNYSLVSFGTALAGQWLGWMLTAGGALVLVPRYLRKPLDANRLWMLGTVTALLLSPLSWINYLVLALPVLIIFSCTVDWSRPLERIRFAVLVVALGFWGPQVIASELVSVIASFVPTYALVALFFLVEKEQRWLRTSATPCPSSH